MVEPACASTLGDVGGVGGLVGLADRVEALGGTIKVDSPAGQGTRLQIDLPIQGRLPASRHGESQPARSPDGRWPGRPRGRSSCILTSTGATHHAAGEEPEMLEHYFTALFSLGQTPDLAHSALPDAPVQPHCERRKTGRNRRSRNQRRPVRRAPTIPANGRGKLTSVRLYRGK
jgi:hypothetical protein